VFRYREFLYRQVLLSSVCVRIEFVHVLQEVSTTAMSTWDWMADWS